MLSILSGISRNYDRSKCLYYPVISKSISNAKKKARNRKGNDRFQTSTENQSTSYPDFTYLLRQLYKRSHPDLIRHSHPEFAKVNDVSMQMLNSIVSTIKKPNQYPPRTFQDIPFYIKSPESGDFVEYVLSIRTAGGDCKKQLTNTFEQFFLTTRLADQTLHQAHYDNTGKFIWNKEYFPILSEEQSKKLEKEEEYEEEEEKY